MITSSLLIYDYIKKVLANNPVPYVCGKCKRYHKPTSKVWEGHIVGMNELYRVSPDVLKKAEDMARDAKVEADKKEETHLKGYQDTMVKAINPDMERWWYGEIIYNGTLHILGRMDGYDTKSELMEDMKTALKLVVRDKTSVALIFKAKIEEILKPF